MKKTNLVIIAAAVVIIAALILYINYQNNQLKEQLALQQQPQVQQPTQTNSSQQVNSQTTSTSAQDYEPVKQPIQQPSIKELRTQLAEQEASRPLTYVSISNLIVKPNETQTPGLFRHSKYDGFMITGLITNSATLVKFENIVLMVSAYSQTQTLMNSQNITLYKIILPGTSQSFSQKVYLPDGATSQNVSITGAIPL